MPPQQNNQCPSQLALVTTVVGICAYAAFLHAQTNLFQKPYHTSILTGCMWVQEMLDGNPRRMRDILGMHSHVFIKLYSILHTGGLLKDTKQVDVEEQVMQYFSLFQSHPSDF